MYMHARCKGVCLSFNADMQGDDFRIDGALSVISHSGTPLGKLPSPLSFGGKKTQMLQNAKIPFISCQSLGIIFAKVEESTLYRLCLSGCQLSASFSLAPWSSDNRWTPQVSIWNPKVFKGWWS